MKLSEALRLGAMSIPAAHGPLVTYDADDQICGACALGTALLACGWWAHPGGRHENDVFPVLAVRAPHPLSGYVQSVFSTIVNLFEFKGWTREQIADWVEQIEQQHEAADIERTTQKAEAV